MNNNTCSENNEHQRPPVVDIQQLSISYGLAKPVLDNISLKIHENEKICLIGPSGEGKSTIMSVIRGEIRPERNQGKILFDGELMKYDHKFLRRHWPLVPTIEQGLGSLISFLTLIDNVAKPLELSGDSRQMALDKAKRGLEKANVAPWLYQSYPDKISGGERQRAIIAKQIVAEGRLILADEPFSALDSINARNILEILKNIESAVLLVTHQPELAIDYCHRLLLLYSGKLHDLTILKNMYNFTNIPSYQDLIDRANELYEESDEPNRTTLCH